MNSIEKRNTGFAVGGVVALAVGVTLLCYSLWKLPSEPAWGFPWTFVGVVGALAVINTGGWCLGVLVGRRNNASVRHGDNERAGGIIFALWVIIAGAMLLAFNSGLLPMEWRRVFFSWQMLLILAGTGELVRRHFVFGTILLVVGGYFIVRLLAPIYPGITVGGAGISFWPVLLIIAGILILGGLIFRPRMVCARGCGGHDQDCEKSSASRASGRVDISAVFGGSEQVYFDPEFRGGEISTLFGGVKLDLRRTDLPEGETYLKIENMFGGVEIDAPEEWNIEIRNESLFGGFVDKRLPGTKPGYEDGRKLVIRASSVFGGGEIK